MDVLIIGDSITQGKIGVNYVTILEEQFPEVSFTNLGLGGDTLVGIGKRLIKTLERRSFDLIVIEAGHNDLLIPEMKSLTPRLQVYAHWFEVRGSKPALEAAEFEKLYRSIIIDLFRHTSVPVLLTTLSCLGESLNSDINRQRAAYNRSIERIAQQYQCGLIPVAEAFDRVLERGDRSDYFFGKLTDIFKSITPQGANKLSSSRVLELTIDGIHLNETGAKLYAELVGSAIAPYID